MEHWTQAAKDFLENHLKGRRAAIAASGADPDEVAGDVRRHLSEELSAKNMATVTAEDVRRVLQRMGELEPSAGLDNDTPAANPGAGSLPVNSPKEVSSSPSKPARYPFTFFFSIILPALTLLIESVTHMCGGVFFDPIPTVWHGLVVACVPLANFFLWQLVRRPDIAKPMWRVSGGGMAAVLSGAYAILFVPLLIPAAIAIIIYGWGLLPLSPLLCLIGTSRMLWVFYRRPKPSADNPTAWLTGGALAGLLALSLVNSPQWLTHYWSSNVAQAESNEEARGSLKNLRVFGHEETLLRACYQNVSGFSGFQGWGWNLGGRPPDVDAARRIYYQMTGYPFNAVSPPQRRYQSARWGFIDEWEWDAGHGGTKVAGRIKGLSLQQSRQDGLVDPEAGWSYVEWILEFKNTSKRAREARAQIALPPGGVVSRLTLWVNGEEREAAFAGTAKTRKAYTDVAVVQRRDPVLVTSAGKDRVLMQCFPVPRDGGTMKVRIGITAPWLLPSEDMAALRLPNFLERNFSLPEGVRHSVWLESRQALKANGNLKEDFSKPGVSALRGELTDLELSGERGVVRAKRSGTSRPAWVFLDGEDGSQIVRQTSQTITHEGISRLILVLDGAVGMTEYMPAIAQALERLPTGLEVGVILARDGVYELYQPQQWTGATRQDLAQRIRRLRGTGGQDNQEALLAGWDWAAEKSDGAVIWIHGPQPVEFDRLEKLSQRLLWRQDQRPLLFDLPVRTGPNRLAESPEMAGLLTSVPRLDSLSGDLERTINQLSGAVEELKFQRDLQIIKQENGGVSDDLGKEGSRHLARLWANDEVGRLMRNKLTADAVHLASAFQLVTPVSGAVVLESQEQFDRAGLQPVSSETVPTVPEPGTLALWMMALVLLAGGARGRIFRASVFKLKIRK